MTSRALVLAIVAIVRQAPPNADVVGQVLTYLHDQEIWFARQIEDGAGLTVEVPLKRGRAKRVFSQALLPFDVEDSAQPQSVSR